MKFKYNIIGNNTAEIESDKKIVGLKSINIQGIIVELYSFMKLENLKDGQIYIYPVFISPNKNIN